MATSNVATSKKYKQVKRNNVEEYKKKTGIASKVIITIFLIIIAMVLVFISGAFDINEVIVEGNNAISSEQIISFSEIQLGTNVFAISKKDIKNKIKENSYVEDVQTKRILPNKIKLIIDERKIEYALQLANSYVYINRQGYIIEISNTEPTVPIILGFTTDLSNIKPNDRLKDEDLNKMNVVIKILETAKNNDLDKLITKIDISNEENYTIYLDSEGKVAYLGNGTELNTRFIYIKAILKEQQGKSGEIFVNMDLNSEWVYFSENV